MPQIQDYNLKVGEAAVVKKAFFGTTTSWRYAGMPSDSVFSLAITHSVGHQSKAYNLFYPISSQEIDVGNEKLSILELRPDGVRFQRLITNG
jgi:hypothetical protein